jgi:hypothetical protein
VYQTNGLADNAAFEMAVTADNAQSVVERELVLRLASLLWRLRRATAIGARALGPICDRAVRR